MTAESFSDPPVRFRKFRSSDQDDARALILAGLAQHFGWLDDSVNRDLEDIESHYVNNGHYVLLAEFAGRIIATGILVGIGADPGRLVRVSVHSDFRRRGIGRKITELLLEEALRRGMRQVLVETNIDWQAAIELYISCGFVEYARDDESLHLCRYPDRLAGDRQAAHSPSPECSSDHQLPSSVRLDRT